MTRQRTLKSLRADLGYKQADVAAMIGVKPPMYSSWEKLSSDELDKIAEALQVKSIKLVIEV